MHHLRNARLIASPDECVAEFSKNAAHRAVVDINVGTVKVAQRLVEAAAHGFADNPGMFGIAKTHRYSQFKRHIEPRRAGSGSVQLDARQVMNRILGGSNQRNDSLQSSLAEGNFKGGSGANPKALMPAM